VPIRASGHRPSPPGLAGRTRPDGPSDVVQVLHTIQNLLSSGTDPWKLLDQARADRRPTAAQPAVRRTKRPSEAEIDHLVARYLELKSLRLVAAELGVDRATVRTHLKQRGVQLVEQARMTDRDVARAVELYVAGQSSVTIGKALGFDNHTVLKALRTAGVRIRPRPGRARPAGP
jgi:DNA-binding CsgD family transcriptional regulator